MSIALFPQERKSENLVYVILPLGIALLLTVVYSGATPDMAVELLPFVTFLASSLALLLYMASPDEIIVRVYYRRLVRSRYRSNLIAHYKMFEEEAGKTLSAEKTQRLVDTMIGNAVSSGPISRRLWKIRALGYYLVAFPLYVLSGVWLAHSYFKETMSTPIIVNLANLIVSIYVADLIVFPCGVVFGLLIYLSFKRHPLTRGIDSTIQFVVDFLYLRILEGEDTLEPANSSSTLPNELRSVLDHMERLLSKNDLDIFNILWQNVVLKKLAPSQIIEIPDVTFRNHLDALKAFLSMGFVAGIFLVFHDFSLPILGFFLFPLLPPVVTIWTMLGMVWFFRISFYPESSLRMGIACGFALLAFSVSAVCTMRLLYPVIDAADSFSLSMLAAALAVVFAISIIIAGSAIWHTGLFAGTPEDVHLRRKSIGSSGIFLIVVGISTLIALVFISFLAPTAESLVYPAAGFSALLVSVTLLRIYFYEKR